MSARDPRPTLARDRGIYTVPFTLSRRERQILVLLVAGLKNHEIGRELGLSLVAVQKSSAEVRQRLGIRTLAQLGAFAQSYLASHPEEESGG